MMGISKKKILLNDFAAFILAIMGPIFTLIAIGGATFGFLPNARRGRVDEAIPVEPEFAMALGGAAALITIISIFFLLKRVKKISNILEHGQKTYGEVTGLEFVKDRGRLSFRYSLGGPIVEGSTAVMKNATTKALTPGTRITLAIDPIRPEKAMVVELYTDPA